MVAKLGYSLGFLIVILGRQQLFTENTLTPILPLLRHKDWETLREVLRLWVVVFIGNMVGAIAVAGVCAKTNAFDPQIREQFSSLGAEAMRHGFGTIVLRAVFAGWLIALLMWMRPYAESAHFWVILAITWLIGVGQFSHVIAGAVEVFSTAWARQVVVERAERIRRAGAYRKHLRWSHASRGAESRAGRCGEIGGFRIVQRFPEA
jgi:formate/nitrite transporter FocA (FNT family)